MGRKKREMKQKIALIICLLTSVCLTSPAKNKPKKADKKPHSISVKLKNIISVVERYGVGNFAFSPDGRILATEGDNGTIVLWDVSSGKKAKILKGHKENVDTFAFSPDGKMLASGGGYEEGTIKLWDVISGKLLNTLRGHKGGGVENIVFSPNVKMMISVGGYGDGSIKLWDISSGKVMKKIKGNKTNPNPVAFSPDGRILATVGCKKQKSTGCDDRGDVIYCLDGVVNLWDISTGKKLRTLRGHKGPITSLVFGQNGKILVTAGEVYFCEGLCGITFINFWKLPSGRLLKKLVSKKEKENVCLGIPLTLSPNGKILAFGWCKYKEDEYGYKQCIPAIKLWEVSEQKELMMLEGTSRIAFSSNGEILATVWCEDEEYDYLSCNSSYLKLYEVFTGKELLIIKGEEYGQYPIPIKFSPDGRILATGGCASYGEEDEYGYKECLIPAVKLWEISR